MENVSTTDLYEVSYYYLNGCKVDLIQCVPMNGNTLCRFTLTGPNLPNLQAIYLNGHASVNLLQFRRAYVEMSRHSFTCKKKWKEEQKERRMKEHLARITAAKGGKS